MEINVEKLVPREWIVENVGQEKIKVYYVNKGRGNSPKPFILPKIVRVDESFIAAIGMYLGDGKLSSDDKHLGFSSIDIDMTKFILDFFTQRFDIALADMTISLRFKVLSKSTLKKWTQALNIPSTKFKLQHTIRARNESCEMEISGKVFRILFGKIIDTIQTSNFPLNTKLRRAFLRGVFAAEGTVGINDAENYIVYVQFCLHHDEDEIASMVAYALKL